jgi:hypothetical protein
MASNAVTKAEEPGQIADYTGGLLAVIERAARDPNVDIDKMERLLAMQERVQERAAKQAFTEAKIAMRPELPEVTRKGRIIIKDKQTGAITQETEFARFEDLHDAVMPVLTRHGFDLKFKNGLSPEGKVRIITILAHVAGHEDDTYFDLPHDSSGSKNAVQAVGSSTSYGKRYGMLAILNIKVVGEDDDGDASQDRDPIIREIERPRDAPFPQGPAKNKTELKAVGRVFWRDVESCGDGDQLDALLRDNGALANQLEAAIPSWWNGGVKNDEPYDGLRTVIERKQAEFGNVGDGWRRNPMRAG